MRVARWLLLAALFGLIGFGMASLADRIDAQQATNQAQDAALDEANRRLVEAGEQPVPTPPPGPPGEAGPGPSDEQVASAVATLCATTGICKPTAAQIAYATATWCAVHGDCIGDRGQVGPAPTPAQLLAASRTYCAAHGECRGATGQKGDKGDTGDTGQQGAPGVVNAVDQCEGAGPDGAVKNVGISYADQTVTLTCTSDRTIDTDTDTRNVYTMTCTYVDFWAFTTDWDGHGQMPLLTHFTVAQDCQLDPPTVWTVGTQ